VFQWKVPHCSRKTAVGSRNFLYWTAHENQLRSFHQSSTRARAANRSEKPTYAMIREILQTAPDEPSVARGA
jgi:hypothetical protein